MAHDEPYESASQSVDGNVGDYHVMKQKKQTKAQTEELGGEEQHCRNWIAFFVVGVFLSRPVLMTNRTKSDGIWEGER